jgi:ABC-type nickel/cobalt efflux system permease component RcnA
MASLMAPEHLSLRVIIMALAVAMGLGAFHALEPGHGKTVVAAYLVGARGTAQHALWLGLIVTATHTAGVYLLGTVTLFASAYIVPEQLYPWLSAASGLLITGLGIYLFWQRYVGTNGTYTHSHDHVYGHSHAHTHAHEHVFAHAHAHPHTSGHHHADHEHHASHDHPTSAHHHHGHAHPASVTFRQLLTLGVTGGIVPCPAALVVLLSAVALQRINFGLLLIVAFSAGLAAVLIAIGLLMVYARRFMSHFQGEGHLITRWLPLTSAALITVFGVVMIGQALVSAGILAFHL